MLTGKGLYIWKIKNAESGDPKKIAQTAYDAGLTHVIIKILDGVWSYNMRPESKGSQTTWYDDLIAPLVSALRERNIEAWGYQYVYLANAKAEALAAINRVMKFALDGFVVDGEVEAKGKPSAALAYSRTLRSTASPGGVRIPVPVALSSYRYPSYHPEFPFDEFIEGSDLLMPQVYWQGATNPAAQLKKSLEEYRRYTRLKPYLYYLPTGSAYTEYNWTAKPSEVLDFMNAAKDLSLPGVNFWEWSHARNIKGMWDVIANYDYNGSKPPAPPTPEPEPAPETMPALDFVRDRVYPFMVKNGYTGERPV